jgi:hypothetical protein
LSGVACVRRIRRQWIIFYSIVRFSSIGLAWVMPRQVVEFELCLGITKIELQKQEEKHRGK